MISVSIRTRSVGVKCVRAPEDCSFIETVEAPAGVAKRTALATFLPESAHAEECPRCDSALVRVDELEEEVYDGGS
jgi:hypothetical protein